MTEKASSVTDASIVAKVVNGDIDAYAEIMLRYQTKLHRYVTFLIHNQTIATDVVQDAFIKAYENLRSFSPEYKFSSWIYRIAHNEAMNAVKKNRRLSDQDIDTLPDLSYDQHLDELVDEELLKENVHGCLDKLGPKYRDVVQLAYFEHMKYEEISDVLRIPTSTVGVRLSRAKLRLKEVCTQKGVKR